MQQNDLETSIFEEIIEPTKDIGKELIEIGLDHNLTDGLFKEIPFVNILSGLGKMGYNIYNRNFTKKFLTFLHELSHYRNQDQYYKFRKKLEKKNEQNKLAEYLIELIDKTIESEKIILYAKLLNHIIHAELEWEEFYNISICLDNLHPVGIKFLRELCQDKNLEEEINVSRDDRESFLSSAGIAVRYGNQMHINKYGKDLYKYCLLG